MSSILKDFYHVEHIAELDNASYNIRLSLNADHEIFKGHFPGNPVTPGVCMMQITKDLTERITAKSLFLSSATNVKFLAIINPEEQPVLDIYLEISDSGDDMKVKNTTKFAETLALKMNLNYKILS